MPPHEAAQDREPARSSNGADSRDSADRPELWVAFNQSVTPNADRRRRTVKTAETVARAIVHDMVAGRFSTGDRLPSEAAMMSQYRVSRTSLREGLRLLEMQGLITLKPGPGGGPVVGTVDPRNLARISTLYLHLGGATYGELFRTHLLTEPLAAEMAARNPDRERVRQLLEPYLEADLPVAGSPYRDVTNSFHGTIQELVDNRVLELFVRVIGHVVHEHIAPRIDPTPMREAIHDEHRQIATAVIAGQASKARRLMTEHFESVFDHYRENWPDRFDDFIEWS